LISRVIDANAFFGTYPKRKVDGSPKSLVTLLKKNGVDLALAVSMKGVFYDYREGNDETLRICSEEHMLLPVGTIDPRRYYGDKGEIERFSQTGFKLVRLFPEYQGWPIDYAPLKMLMREIDDMGMPLMITANAYGMSTAIAELHSSFSFPIILASIGYWTMSEAIAIMKHSEKIYVETHLVDSPDGIKILCEEAGAERLVFGSNLPLTYFLGPFLAVRNSDITESDKRLILGGNIERLVAEKE